MLTQRSLELNAGKTSKLEQSGKQKAKHKGYKYTETKWGTGGMHQRQWGTGAINSETMGAKMADTRGTKIKIKVNQ